MATSALCVGRQASDDAVCAWVTTADSELRQQQPGDGDDALHHPREWPVDLDVALTRSGHPIAPPPSTRPSVPSSRRSASQRTGARGGAEVDDDDVEQECSDDDTSNVGSVDVANAATERKAIRRRIKGTKIYFESANPRDVVMINAVECGYRVVRNLAEADVIWIEAQPMSTAAVKDMENHQRVNFFPGMKMCATKCEFSRIMGRMQRMFPGEFDFVPRTWSLPSEASDLLESAQASPRGKKSVYVVKPDAGCGGDGIYLTTDVTRISHPQCVVQEYLSDPLLLDGLKFDLRVYVVVTSIAPLRFYVCREGLCRLAVEPYEAPTTNNMRNTNLHLTNYSLNKFSSKFVPNTDPNDDTKSSKRSITTAFRQLRTAYGPRFDEASIWDKITDIAGKTLAAVAPIVGSVAGMTGEDEVPAANATYLPRCFHVLGFDVFIDNNLDCHLFEINNHPSLLTDAPVDFTVKTVVVKPVVRMVAFDAKRAKIARVEGNPAITREDWEGMVLGSQYISCAHMASSLSPYVDPFRQLCSIFVEACGGVRSRAFGEMTATRFVKFARLLGAGSVRDASNWSTVDADLMFQKETAKWGRKYLAFHDFVDLVLGDLGGRLFPRTAKCSLERLNAVVAACVRSAD